RSEERDHGHLSRHPSGPLPRGPGCGGRGNARQRRRVRRKRGAGQARREVHAPRGRRRAQAFRPLAGGRQAMTPEIGHFALVLAFFLATVQASLPLAGAARRNQSWMAVGSWCAQGQLLFIAFAFLALMHAYVISDFSVAAVASNSNSAVPLVYKIAGTWGNH